MRRVALAVLALAALAVAAACSHLPRVDPRPAPIGERVTAFPQTPVPAARLLFVSVAGLDASAWQTPGAMPTLAALADAGVVADRVGTIAPASAYPVHATLVTGRSPKQHGVPADRRIGRHGVRSERYWHASQLHGASLWQLAAEKRVPIAALDWPVTVGAAVDLLLPDLTPVRRGERYADLLAGSATPALAAAVRDAGEEGEAAAPAGPVRDRLLVDLACRTAVAARPPALLLLRLTQTEPALRDVGPGSAAARAAFAGADAELTRLLGCFDDAGLLADAAVAVVGDRVFEPVHSVVLPNVALADARLVDLEPTGGVQSWLAIARSNGGSAFVYARDEGRAVEAREVLEGLARRSGAFRVVPAVGDVGARRRPRRLVRPRRRRGLLVRRRGARGARRARCRARGFGKAPAGRGRDARVRRVRTRLPARRARPADVAARRRADARRVARPRAAGRRGARARRPPRRGRAGPRPLRFRGWKVGAGRTSRSSSTPPSAVSTTACARASWTRRAAAARASRTSRS